MQIEGSVEQNFENKADKEIARELSIPEEKVKEMRRERGFLRLEEFEDSVTSPILSALILNSTR